MADSDFNIKVVTTADTTGLRQTRDEIEKTRQAAEKARQDAGAANLFSRIPPKGGTATEAVEKDGAGLTGTAVGLGTIVTLLTRALAQWKAFNAEQDRWVEGMIKAEEKARALGESIIAIQDAAISARLHGTDSLQESFNHLNQEIIRLKTEQSELNLPEQGEEWKKLNSQIVANEAELKKVTAALGGETAAKQRAARSELEKRVPGLKPDDQVKEADAQTRRILQNEQAAAKARAEGREKDADMFQKSADQYKASATPKQLEDLKRIHDLQNQLNPSSPTTPYRQPQPGEPGGGEVGTGGERAKSAAQLRADQEQNRKDREAGIMGTAQQGAQSKDDRDATVKEMLEYMKHIWGN